ncbi:MAG: small ribosomal subunit biogenesis GTPase RsgA [Ketobacter sp.]|nr:MAG: small ribosomal subunit biogenesis GTPase RsgA [Ketobacter sp.]
MSKRKLTRRQSWRIEKVQQEKADRIDKKARKLSDSDELGDEEEGLIVSHFGTLVEVEPLAPPTDPIRCHFRTNLGSLVTGDRVVMRRGQSGYGVIETILPRTSLLSRPDPRGNLKPVAANIDFMILVVTPEPAPSGVLIDRYLVAAELQKIPIKILLNKTDLLNEMNEVAIDALLNTYRDIGYPVMECSAKTEQGLAELQLELDQKTSVFVGQSGVGKTSLVNALLPGVNARVGALSEGSKLGRHTTTNARLFHFPFGGDLIDSPGIREFGLWHLDPDKVIEGFRDFDPWRFECRFRDCRHLQEPGCALHQAVENGKIERQRVENYFSIREALLEGR